MRAGILVFFFFFSLAAQAQFERVQMPGTDIDTTFKDSVTVIPGKLISSLTGAIGHIKMNNGHWAAGTNLIPYENPDYNNPFYEQYALGSENFNQMRIHEIMIDSQKYYMLIVQYTKGYYKKPDTEEDWTYYKSADYYIFNLEELKRLYPDSLKIGKKFYASIPVKYAGNLPAASINTMLKKIDHDLNVNLYNHKYYDTTVKIFFQFVLYPKNGKSGTVMRFNTRLGYANTGKWPAQNDFSSFATQYYEVPIERFKAFARPVKNPKSK